jgi:prepilin-type N-terminal cleavage/methylation domain-containing protein
VAAAVKPVKTRRAFTLIEILLVIAIVAILAALLLPSLSRGVAKGKRTKCMANLKQLGVAFHNFAHEHGDKFPMDVSTNSGGTLEYTLGAIDFANAFRSFQAISNELLDTKLLVCPADNRIAAEIFAALRNENVSYFVTRSAQFGDTDSIIAGDRNISGEWRSGGKILRIGNASAPGWTHELHEDQGNLLFGDARVELVTSAGLQRVVSSSRGQPFIVLPIDSPVGTQMAQMAYGNSSQNSGSGNSGNGSSGNSPSGTAENPGPGATRTPQGNPGGEKLLDQLERIFQKPAGSSGGGSQPSIAAAGSPPRVSGDEPSPQGQMAGSNKIAVVTVNAPEALTAGDPWPVSLGQIVTRMGSRSAWWLLFLLLAALITVEVIRRRRARKKAES